MKWTDRALFLVENLDLRAASGVETAEWEHFQLSHLMYEGKFRHEVKSRQIAWSFTAACEAVALALLRPKHPYLSPDSLFLSINLDEAQEKIRYAKTIYENLNIEGLPNLVRDNVLSLEFENGSRLHSLPARPPRGKPRFNVYLDEFAHVQHDRQIYTAALPITSKGGAIRMASSPMGSSGVFWEVGEQEVQNYPDYARKYTPWWQVKAFCNNIRLAFKQAPQLATEERVNLFGTETIVTLYRNMLLEDFQQEYECMYVDEVTAWLTWAEIKANQEDDLFCLMKDTSGNKVGVYLDAVREIALSQAKGAIESTFGVGVDIGRTRNATVVTGVTRTSTHQYPMRFQFVMDNMDFESQYEVLTAIMSMLNVVKITVDRNGIGRNIAEKLESQWPTKAEGVDFTSESKQEMAADIKQLFQQRRAPIPIHRDLAYQLHSVKKLVTPSRNNVFDVDRNEKHHADRFWSATLGYKAIHRGLNIISGMYGYHDSRRTVN